MYAAYADLDSALCHADDDPQEVNNLAFDPEFSVVAERLKEMLLSIVFLKDRIEVSLKKDGSGTEVYKMK